MTRRIGTFICRRCGLPVTCWLDTWKHASGGKLGKTPTHRRHRPDPIEPPADDSQAVLAMLRARARKGNKP